MKVKFTKLAALLLTGVALLAAGCTDYEVDIQQVDKKVNELAVKTAADLAAQVDALKAMISTLESNYKAADEALKAQIQEQINTINGQISDLQNLKLDKSTFDAYKTETAETLRLLNEAVNLIKENYATKEELNTAVAGVYEKLNDYVLKTTFEEFVKIAATKAEVEAAKTELQEELAKAKSELEQAIKDGDEALEKKMNEKIGKIEEAIDKLESDLEALGIRVTALEDTVDTIVDELAFAEGDLQGYIDDADAATLEAAMAYTDEMIDSLIEQLNEILDEIYNRLAMALQRIQSIVFVPDYDDLKITSNMAFVTQTVTPEAEGDEAAPANPQKLVLAVDEPTQVTYQFLPAQYAGTIARAIKANLEEPWTREEAKDYGYDGIVAWFSVKPVNTRADEAEAAAPEFNIISVDKYDDTTGEITFTVLPKNVASAAFAANGIKPVADMYMTDAAYNNAFYYPLYLDEEAGLWYTTAYRDYVHYVYNYEDLKAFEARAAFAAQLRLYHLQDYDLDIDWDTFEFEWIDYENELASAYNVLYPGVTEMEILPDPYKPDLDEDGKPKTDEEGNTILVKAVPEHQQLPYSALRKDGEDAVGEKPEQDPKGYRIILDQAVPGIEIDGKVYTVEDAAKKGQIVPAITTNFKEFTYDKNTAETLDKENFVETAQVYAEIEMNPEKSAAERKLAVGNIITGHYFFESVIGKTPFEGDVEITKPLGAVDACAEIIWTYENDADVDHNLFYPDEQVEGGTIYQRLVYNITLDEEDLTFLKTKLDVDINDFAGLEPKEPTVAIADLPEEGAEPVFADPIALSEADLKIENVAIKDGKLYADFSFPQEGWNKIYKIVAPYETETALITVNGVVTTIDRNREKVVLGPYEYTFIVNGEDFYDGYYHWTSEPLHADVFEAFDAEGVINVKGITLENGDFEYDADQEDFNAAELEGKLRMADPSGTAKGYVDFDRNEIVLNTLSTLTPEVLAGDLFSSGERSETDPNLWIGNEVTRNVTTYIGEEVELVIIFNYKVPDYNFLHLSYYTFNTEEEVPENNFIQKYPLPTIIEGVATPYDDPIWWTQVNPSYFTTVKEDGTSEADAQTRISNRYALADYDVAYINLAELAFNVVDDQDNIIEDADLEELGLVAKFVYTDSTKLNTNMYPENIGTGKLPLPDQKASNDEFLLYKSLWVDNTTFYYLTNEHPFIPALGTLTLNVGTVGQGGYAFPVATRFEYPKDAVKYPGVSLDYSTYAMVRWTPFQAPKADGFTIVLDENKVYAEPLFKGMELKDNRPNDTSFYVIKDGEWVVGDAAENATKTSSSNGYMKDIVSKDAYHIKAAFDYSDVELPAELKKLLKVKYSADGVTFVDENDENETLTPYVVFDYTSEVQFRGTISIPVVVRLENPWQQEIKFAYDFTIKGVE